MTADLFGRRIEIEGLEILGVVQAHRVTGPTWSGTPYRVTFELIVREVETADGERVLMTPEQAAEQAAHVLKRAAAWADNPETVSGLVQVADGWTRLHTALKMGQSELVTVNMHDTVIREEPGQVEPEPEVSDKTRDALVALGWTPPAEPRPDDVAITYP
ncbi:hypothetical protein OG884_26575 [Streptosporangium sp. NBC_01755]|uniref:hypothetical protein n=1 Tax=Streptosporangium sp. NBC_01755 TaxID=2975949 RepID=UPI002DDB8F9A|nr:hypothetical protein [Streptosporangium sp. NBC_01755]WSC98415.1 hypothetical protein OG884_26575 [Streptosporangium sp. NBC_01755]